VVDCSDLNSSEILNGSSDLQPDQPEPLDLNGNVDQADVEDDEEEEVPSDEECEEPVSEEEVRAPRPSPTSDFPDDLADVNTSDLDSLIQVRK
jgi:hypothetical protein